jgi:hypothetical protein
VDQVGQRWSKCCVFEFQDKAKGESLER